MVILTNITLFSLLQCSRWSYQLKLACDLRLKGNLTFTLSHSSLHLHLHLGMRKERCKSFRKKKNYHSSPLSIDYSEQNITVSLFFLRGDFQTLEWNKIIKAFTYKTFEQLRREGFDSEFNACVSLVWPVMAAVCIFLTNELRGALRALTLHSS